MDLEFTEEQDAFRAAVRELFERDFGRDYVRECDRTKTPPHEAFRRLGDLGYLGIGIPEEYGGAGASTVDIAILLEEVGRGFLDLGMWVFRVVSHGGHAIATHGDDAQKERYLPQLAAGDLSVCFALTEPEAGSDAASITTTATRKGDDYVINGQKIFCSGFKVSDYVLVSTRTSNEGRKHEGITTFFVPTDAPGLSSTAIETLGHWPLGTTLLHFDEVEVPVEQRIGPENGGWPLLMDMLEYERLCLSAARTGAAHAALDDTLAYVKERHQFGQPIGSFQAISHKLADMQVMADVARMLVYRYAHRLDRGVANMRDAASLKLYAAEAYKTIADLGLQALGGYGYTMEYDLQRHYRESRLGTIGGGTSEIQRNIIAKTMGL